MSDEYDFLFKSIVVGDGGVGKTALTLRFSKDFFSEDYKMTIGVDFHVKTLSIETNEGPIRAKLQIWDTGGQERFSSIRPMYYRGSLGALLIFDLTNYESFEHLPQWIEEVRANVKSDIPLLLVGNKCDLLEERTVTNEEINEFTGKFNLYYMETSAKTGDGVGDCFYILACLMIGSGVPDQFFSTGAAYRPGQFTAGAAAHGAVAQPSSHIAAPSIKPEPTFEFEYAAPPVPAKSSIIEPEPTTVFETESEFEFAAPPVPEKSSIVESEASFTIEPEPEIEFEAPSVRPAPEPVEFEFKPPEEILSAAIKDKGSAKEMTKTPVFSPKAVPFSGNIPVPAPAPEGFAKTKVTHLPEPTKEPATPFFMGKPAETTQAKAQPFSVPFDSPTTPKPIKAEASFPIPSAESSSAFPFPASTEIEESSDSLVDYMPETIISKKEQKKLEKQRQKEEKERAKKEAIEAKERAKREAIEAKEKAKRDAIEAKEQAKLDKQRKEEEAKEKFRLEKEKEAEEARKSKEEKGKKKEKPKKEKKEKPEEVKPVKTPEVPATLFQSLSQKAEAESKPSAFVPFMAAEKSPATETSKLRIIPNVADIDSGTFSPIPSSPVEDTSSKKEKRREIRICQQCGAMLSSDYAFCNKCGAKL